MKVHYSISGEGADAASLDNQIHYAPGRRGRLGSQLEKSRNSVEFQALRLCGCMKGLIQQGSFHK